MDIVKNHMAEIAGRQIYPVVANGPVRAAFTMDNDIRPEIVAILITMLNPEAAPGFYPGSKFLAEKILERKNNIPGVKNMAMFMSSSLETNLSAWYKNKKGGAGRVNLSADIRRRIFAFAETMVRATMMYLKTLEGNRILWDQDAPGYIGSGHGFNLAFDMSYIMMAAA